MEVSKKWMPGQGGRYIFPSGGGCVRREFGCYEGVILVLAR